MNVIAGKDWTVVASRDATNRFGRPWLEIHGHSLPAIRVMSKIKNRFRVELGLSELFAGPRLEAIATVIDAQIGHRASLPGELSSTTGKSRPARGFGLFHDKVVLVTGGSRGIGLSTALLLAEQGAKVAINYRDNKAQVLSVKEMIETGGGTAEIFGADITCADEVAAMVAAVHNYSGHIHVLIVKRAHPLPAPAFPLVQVGGRRTKSLQQTQSRLPPCRAVAPNMVQQGRGSIIAPSSTPSKRSNPGFLAQNTVKAAVDALCARSRPSWVRRTASAPTQSRPSRPCVRCAGMACPRTWLVLFCSWRMPSPVS